MSKLKARRPAAAQWKLALIAAAGIALIVLMTALTMQERSVKEAQHQAQESHERRRAFGRLQYVARMLHTHTQAVIFDSSPRAQQQLAKWRENFQTVLEEVRALPLRNAHEREVGRQVEAQARQMLEAFERASQIMQRTDTLWRSSGYRAGLAEIQAFTQPYNTFIDTVSDQIWKDNELHVIATRQFADTHALSRTLATGVLVLGFVLAVILFLNQLKRWGLEQAHAALAADDGRRRDFLADAAHELRVPLTIIRGEAQLALQDSRDLQPETTEALERILEQTRCVGRVLDDLFLIARAEAGGL